MGTRFIEAESLRVIAELALAQADRSRASSAASAALAIFDQLGASAEAQALREWLAAGDLGN